MDPKLMAKVALHDPATRTPSSTVGHQRHRLQQKMVKALMPDAPLDSWSLVFDPAVASKVAKCGISVLDSPAEMIRVVMSYLGKDPNSQSADDLAPRKRRWPRSGRTFAISIPRNTSRRWPMATFASPWPTTET